jgi:hypothetical protein
MRELVAPTFIGLKAHRWMLIPQPEGMTGIEDSHWEKEGSYLWRHYGRPRPMVSCSSHLNVGLGRPWTSPLQPWTSPMSWGCNLGVIHAAISMCGCDFRPLEAQLSSPLPNVPHLRPNITLKGHEVTLEGDFRCKFI